MKRITVKEKSSFRKINDAINQIFGDEILETRGKLYTGYIATHAQPEFLKQFGSDLYLWFNTEGNPGEQQNQDGFYNMLKADGLELWERNVTSSEMKFNPRAEKVRAGRSIVFMKRKESKQYEFIGVFKFHETIRDSHCITNVWKRISDHFPL